MYGRPAIALVSRNEPLPPGAPAAMRPASTTAGPVTGLPALSLPSTWRRTMYAEAPGAPSHSSAAPARVMRQRAEGGGAAVVLIALALRARERGDSLPVAVRAMAVYS